MRSWRQMQYYTSKHIKLLGPQLNYNDLTIVCKYFIFTWKCGTINKIKLSKLNLYTSEIGIRRCKTGGFYLPFRNITTPHSRLIRELNWPTYRMFSGH